MTAPTFSPSKLDGKILLVQLWQEETKMLFRELGAGDSPAVLLDRIAFVAERAMTQIDAMIETDPPQRKDNE